MPSDARSRFAVKNLEILFNGLRNRFNVEFLDHLILNTSMSTSNAEFLSLQKKQGAHN